MTGCDVIRQFQDTIRDTSSDCIELPPALASFQATVKNFRSADWLIVANQGRSRFLNSLILESF